MAAGGQREGRRVHERLDNSPAAASPWPRHWREGMHASGAAVMRQLVSLRSRRAGGVGREVGRYLEEDVRGVFLVHGADLEHGEAGLHLVVRTAGEGSW